jgi:thioester reductase-like protein
METHASCGGHRLAAALPQGHPLASFVIRLALSGLSWLSKYGQVPASEADAPDGLLLTGATGFLGMELLARYLKRGERTIYTLVRAASDAQADLRVRQLLESLVDDPDEYAGRVHPVRGDVSRSNLGMSSARREHLAEHVGEVVHCAASVSFDISLQRAREVNVHGTRRILELAALCDRRGGLRGLSHVSTAYVAGAQRGVFAEHDLPPREGFRNAYERSKAEAEQLVRDWAQRLPLQIFRPSIVVGDSRSGWTPAFNVIYGPLRAFACGTYTAVPGRRAAPVDVVPVDYVADAIISLAGRPGTVHHLTAAAAAATLGEMIELACAHFGRRRPVLVSPALYRRVAHPLLMMRANERQRRGLRRSEAYFPYFDARVRYDDAQARVGLAPLGVQVPPLADYFARLMQFAEDCEWGRRAVPRKDAIVRAQSARADSLALV